MVYAKTATKKSGIGQQRMIKRVEVNKMRKKKSLRMGLEPGVLGLHAPRKYWQAQVGSELKNFRTKTAAKKWLSKK
jgi:hypothetical protein